jgi:DNA polymerase III subunit delta
MTPDEFLRSLDKGIEPAYLFLGPEMYFRQLCRSRLMERVLPEEDREQGFTRYDLDESDFTTVIDDARSFSLFAANRLLYVTSAEGALPRTRAAAAVAAAEDNEEEGNKASDGALLKRYLDNPPPGTVLLFDSSRYEFEGEDKTKLQRVQKFYGVLPTVEFRSLTPAQARKMAGKRAQELGLQIAQQELDLLLEALGTDVMRLHTELEKLSLLAGSERKITPDDIVSMVPDARATSIFTLVNALARKDREAAFEALAILVREGEYLPLALTFLGTQFRLALVAREANLSSAGAIQSHFSKLGVPMWGSRADQVHQTASAFSLPKLRRAVQRIYETDKALRDARPDDRTVMERFVLELSA